MVGEKFPAGNPSVSPRLTHPAAYRAPDASRPHLRPRRPYRLRVPLPITVAFRCVSYVLQLQTVPAAGRHEFVAHDAAAGLWWPIGPSYLTREFLERAVFEVGVPVRRDTVGAVIMRRLVCEGRAETIPTPAVDLATLRPASTSHLGEWLNAPRR